MQFTHFARLFSCVALVLLAGCAGGGVTAPRAAGPPVPLDSLPACRPPAVPDEPVEVDGSPELPEGGYLTVVESDGPLVVANGFVPLDPVAVRAHYEGVAATVDGWELVTAEDEAVEAEVLLRSPEHRFFVVAQAVCPQGSALYLRVITESEGPS
ncbi:hypothetical protein [Cellulomonas cellasea]|uniref:Lipoprotein n=2 Tax=Cellulomonas cellasea TaxID=43670 RepID=A0A0A0B753_9CELL|nr:hypothetical protein [Cellulomonas cellasea]KGM01066.1 hypothetical protein Q760_04165 [Cellulomonas cellasea DSM 20118]GEA87536.1 hypothetical protein CCE01nite_14850 [Cellulomonas cellasea]